MGGVSTTSRKASASSGYALDEPGARGLAGLGDEVGAADVAPDREWREARVAEGVVPVTVRVDHRHEVSGELPQVVAQLIGQAVVRPRVDDREAGVAPDRADRLVERLVSANPDPVADLVPDRGHTPSWSM